MITTTFKLNLDDVEAGFAAMRRQGENPASIFKELRKPLRDDQRDHRKNREGPDGPWAKRAASTLARLHRYRRPMGRLPGAVSYSADKRGVRGISRIKWSAAHQDGATVGRGSRLPKRTFLWLSAQLLDLAENTFAAAIAAAFRRG